MHSSADAPAATGGLSRLRGWQPAGLICGLLVVGSALALLPPLVAAAVAAAVIGLAVIVAGPTWSIMLAFAVIPLELFVLDQIGRAHV